VLPDFIEAAFPLAAEIGVEFLTMALPNGDSAPAGIAATLFHTHLAQSVVSRGLAGSRPVEV
jgi:hypothetical protein